MKIAQFRFYENIILQILSHNNSATHPCQAYKDFFFNCRPGFLLKADSENNLLE